MSKHLVLAIGAFPPPVNGQSKNLDRIARDIAACDGVHLVRRSVASGSLKKTVVTHSRKALRIARAWMTLVALTPFYKKRTLYLVADGGRGLFYTRILAASARALGYRIMLQHRTFQYVRNPNPLMGTVERHRKASGGAHVFLCGCMVQQFEKAYGQVGSRVHVVGNLSQYVGFADAGDAPESRATGPVRVSILSNLLPEKGIDTFVEMARQIIAADEGFNFTIAGPIPQEVTKNQITSLVADHPDRVAYVGPLYGEEKRQHLKDTDIFVFPTRYPFEAQPNVIFEAMSLGATCIAPDRGCIAEDIGTTGIVISAQDESNPAAYAQALLSYAGTNGRALLDHRQTAAFNAAQTGVDTARAAYAGFLEDLTGAVPPAANKGGVHGSF